MDRRLAATFVLLLCATGALFAVARVLAFEPFVEAWSFPVTAVSLVILALSVPAALWLAHSVSRPFRQLAVAAEDLGRGRFDVTVPESGVPEVREIGAALSGAARSFELRLREERLFLEQTSHVIRTPLTGIRLELEDLLQRSEDKDVQESVRLCVEQVEKLDRDADTVLALARDWIAAGQPLAELGVVARHMTDRWTSRMAGYDSDFRAFLHGDAAVQVIPGVVEQVLDQVLSVVVQHGFGAVRLTFTGADRMVQLVVVADGPDRPDDPRLQRARLFAETVGGTVDGVLFSPSGLKILLPGR